MRTDIIAKSSPAYIVSTPIFDGPLDLLLYLIEHAELDITKLSVALVTDQYLGYLNTLDDRTAEEVSFFLVIAAKLLQIKSEALLPRPPSREEGELDPGEALAQQLMIYKRFKEMGKYLHQREEADLHTYLRIAPPPKVERSVDLSNLDLESLFETALSVLYLADQKSIVKSALSFSTISIQKKIVDVVNTIRDNPSNTFRSLVQGVHSRLEIVLTFLAVLELMKQCIVIVKQEVMFGEIIIELGGSWGSNDFLMSEFGK